MGRSLLRAEVYALIDGERAYQDRRWNPQTTTSHGEHSWEEWFTYMTDYIQEAQHILSREPQQEGDQKAAAIMRKVGAMAVAAMEQNGATPR